MGNLCGGAKQSNATTIPPPASAVDDPAPSRKASIAGPVSSQD